MGGFGDHGRIIEDWMPPSPSPSPRSLFAAMLGGEAGSHSGLESAKYDNSGGFTFPGPEHDNVNQRGHGVVLGDYVIEYGDNGSGDEYEDFPGANGNWWTSCILYQVFDKFRCSKNRRRTRVSESRQGSRRMSYDTSNSDEGSVGSTELAEYRASVAEDDFLTRSRMSRGRTGHRSSRRRPSRFHDN